MEARNILKEDDAPTAPAMAYRYPAAHGVDLEALRAYRLQRVRDQLRQRDVVACLLFDPINIRYATDVTNMQVWTLHNPARYLFVPVEGPVVLFDYHTCGHLSDGFDTVDEVRPAKSVFYYGAGPRLAEKAAAFADEIDALMRRIDRTNRRLGIDQLHHTGVACLEAAGISLVDGQEILEHARMIKSAEEIAAMRVAIDTCERGMARMHEALTPGMTEADLWSILHAENIRGGGEWIETRLLASGPRTNPWFQEASLRPIEAGDMVTYDTDLIGPFGYCADISRAVICGGGPPTDEQKHLYALAHEQIEFNIDLVRPGIGLREFSEKGFRLPDECLPNRYSVVAHGVGLCDEHPRVLYSTDFPASGYDGVIEAGMTLCIESYVGRVGGGEGVKLEEQVLVTETGVERLSTFPFERALLAQ